MRNKKIIWLSALFLLTAVNVFPQDKEGSKDYPLISRYEGSVLCEYSVVQFDEYILPLGKMKDGKLTKSQKLQGKVYKIGYICPEDHTVLQVAKNYEIALKNNAFEILFSGTGEELSEGGGPDSWREENNWGKAFPWPLGSFEIGPHPKQRHFSAKLSRPEGDVYVSLWIGAWDEKPRVRLDVTETKAMETGLVTVNAEALAKDISKTGHVAVYGIYFDTGKAEIKTESEPVLNEIAKLLQQSPNLNLYVVGHTDNIGAFNSNMELSQLRAEAVMKTLVSKYSIDANRLHSVGVGPVAPVASNKTEEGRAKNRRVELVEQ